jgi:penicillin G amidase
MRPIPLLISAVLTVLLIILFNTRTLLPAPLGFLLSPQHGVWQNAEANDFDFDDDMALAGLKGKATAYFDDRLVPHVFADRDEDAYFIQGYLHARFRLWQMELQTHLAGGRLCEILGKEINGNDVLNKSDRYFRRLGMVSAAEKSLEMIEAEPSTKAMMDSYTAGVNAYIAHLTESQLPIEYKLLGYRPEPWTNLKTALFMKYMAFDLAGYENDFEFTQARDAFTRVVNEKMFPPIKDSVDPIIPRGTIFNAPQLNIVAPATRDSVYMTYLADTTTVPKEPLKPNKENGSNNWAVSGTKTRSGHPILCNDPHLGLNLPSIWYEMQMHTPTMNVYGASFLGAPGVAIGFNDSCAFGFTNGGRDVRDYYEIKFKDKTHQEYWFNGEWKSATFRYEKIGIKGQADFIDTVAYTVFGPVIFDEKYAGRSNNGKCYAVRWKAHDPSNELLLFYKLNRAKNYDQYLEAIKNLHTPGQNAVFAAKNGDIALWCQGEFPAKWKGQGDYIMPGTDSSYMWQGMIPQEENPHQVNPERGFVSSANQAPADLTYPYYLGGAYPEFRGTLINRRLANMQQITPQDMMQLQTENYNLFAEMAMPLLTRNINESSLTPEEQKFWQLARQWNLQNEPGAKGATVFNVLWDQLETIVWNDELLKAKMITDRNKKAGFFSEGTLLENLLKDSSFAFVDDINTPQKETLADDIATAFHRALPILRDAAGSGKLEWSAFKGTHISHLLKIPQFSRPDVHIGGGAYVINAARDDHGPSWRMVVDLSPETEAYGIYPGGQTGNPGSRFYDSFITDWAAGKYYRLWMMKTSETSDPRAKWKMNFHP